MTDGDNSRSVVLGVDGMSCEACAARLGRVLKAIDGVDEVCVNLQDAQATVILSNDQLPTETLEDAIRGAGFSVRV